MCPSGQDETRHIIHDTISPSLPRTSLHLVLSTSIFVQYSSNSTLSLRLSSPNHINLSFLATELTGSNLNNSLKLPVGLQHIYLSNLSFTKLYTLPHFGCWAVAEHCVIAGDDQDPWRQASSPHASSPQTQLHDRLRQTTRKKLFRQLLRSYPTIKNMTSSVTHLCIQKRCPTLTLSPRTSRCTAARRNFFLSKSGSIVRIQSTSSTTQPQLLQYTFSVH